MALEFKTPAEMFAYMEAQQQRIDDLEARLTDEPDGTDEPNGADGADGADKVTEEELNELEQFLNQY